MDNKEKQKGFYECSCGIEVISNFPFKTMRCLACGLTVELVRLISDEESRQIQQGWENKNNCEGE